MSHYVVFGSAAVDLKFRVKEAPQKNESVQGEFDPTVGGKGAYQAVSCARMSRRGSKATLIAAIGNDLFGNMVLKELEKQNVDQDYIELCDCAPGERFATDVVGVIAIKGQESRSRIGCRAATERMSMKFITEKCAPIIESCDVLLLSLDGSVGSTETVLNLARRSKRRIILNASPVTNIPLNILRGVDYLVISRDDACKWLAQTDESSKNGTTSIREIEIGKRFLNEGTEHVIITMNQGGCVVIDQQGYRHYASFPAGERELLSMQGARSAFCGGLAVALTEPIDIVWASPNDQQTAELNMIATASAAWLFMCTHGGDLLGSPTRDVLEDSLIQSAPLEVVARESYDDKPTEKPGDQKNAAKSKP